MGRPITLTSFGYLHGPPPEETAVFDVRDILRDPARVDGLLDSDGFDPAVRAAVMATSGAKELVVGWATLAPVVHEIAVGCAGGRHRSVALVEMLAGVLVALGYAVRVEHRDVHHPRVIKGDSDG